MTSLRGILRTSVLLITAAILASCGRPIAQAELPGGNPVVIPFENHFNKIMLRTEINGTAPQSFALDTGASICAVKWTWAQASGGKIEDLGMLAIAGGEQPIRVGLLGMLSFHLDGLDFTTRRSVVVPMRNIEPYYGINIDGVVGRDLFERFVVEVDFVTQKVTLHEPRTYAATEPGSWLPMATGNGQPEIRASVTMPNGKTAPVTLAIDSGMTRALELNRPFVDSHGGAPTGAGAIVSTTPSVAGEIPVVLSRVPQVKLGAVPLTQVVTEFSRATRGELAKKNPDGLIGGDLLRRFKVVFDYPHQRLLLAPNPAVTEAFEDDMSGMELRAEGAQYAALRVQSIVPGSPAAEVGVRASDLIVSFDGRPLPAHPMETVRARLQKPGRVALEVNRGSERISVVMMLRRIV